MKQRVNAITIGCDDLGRAREFYTKLGWKPKLDLGDEGPIFYQVGGSALMLWTREALAEDSGVEPTTGFSGITLGINLDSPAEVDALIEEARAAGATIVREPDKTFWGGYNAVFHDPDGQPWEVARNPEWTITESGDVEI